LNSTLYSNRGADAEDMFIKREQFAVSLRKVKKAEILNQRRKRYLKLTKVVNLDIQIEAILPNGLNHV
jgi:hypothetical protein